MKEFAAALSALDQQPAPPMIDTRPGSGQATRSARGRRTTATTNARRNPGNSHNRTANRVSLPNWGWLLTGVVAVLAIGLFISRYSGAPDDGKQEQDTSVKTPAPDPTASADLADSRPATETAASESNLALLQGDWEVVEEEFKGVKTSNEEIQQSQKRLHVSGNDFNILRKFSDGSEGAFRGKIHLDDANSPNRFDWAGTEPGGKATEMLGLYEIQGDTLRIVYNFHDQNSTPQRPQRFASSGIGAGVVVSTFRRTTTETSTAAETSTATTPEANTPDPAAAAENSQTADLFNGKDLTGWKAYGGGKWTWLSQELVATPSPDGTPGFLMTDADYESIDIQFEIFLNFGTNSGLLLRGDPAGNFSGAQQMEVQLIDDQFPQFKDAPYKTGALHGTFPREADAAVKVRDWNSVRVRLDGRKLEVWVNRRQILNRNLDTAREQFAERPWLTKTRGRIGLQISGNADVKFRHFRIQDLSNDRQAAVDNDQPQALFNGVDLTGWSVDGDTNHWNVSGDELQISEMALSRRGMLRTVAEFSDFRLTFEARMSEHVDAGITVRQPDSRKALKINLLTGTPNQFNEGTGSLWWPDENGGTGGSKPPIKRLDLVPDSWHQFEIEVTGSRIIVRIDNTEIQRADISALPNSSTIRNRAGAIGLQSSSKTQLSFRKMYLTNLTPVSSEKVLQQLQGRWRSVSQARGGNRLSVAEVAAEDKVLTITGDRFALSYYLVVDRSQRGLEEGRILSINTDATPAEIDMIFDTRKPEPLLFKGIFELTENRLRHCYRKCPINDSNCSRPADFSTQKGDPVFAAEYVREAD